MIGPSYANSVSSMIAANGSFRFGGLQNGIVNFSLTEKNMPFPPKGFTISRIERDGALVQQLQVRDGETISGVKIFVAYGSDSARRNQRRKWSVACRFTFVRADYESESEGNTPFSTLITP